MEGNVYFRLMLVFLVVVIIITYLLLGIHLKQKNLISQQQEEINELYKTNETHLNNIVNLQNQINTYKVKINELEQRVSEMKKENKKEP